LYRRVIVVAVSCLAVLLPGHAAHAQGPRLQDPDLAQVAAAIVTGTVRHITAGRDPQVGYLYTYVTVDVDEVIKGRLDRNTIVVKQLGGRVGDLEMVVYDQARFTPGEEVLLFLSRRPRDGTLQTTALWQGKWTLEREPVSGDRLALRSPFGERPGLSTRRQRPGDDVRLMAPFRAELRAWSRERGDRMASSRQPLRTVPPEPVPIAGAEAGATASEAAASASAGFTLLGSGARWHQADDGVAVPVDVQASGQTGLSGGGLTEIDASRGLWNQAGSTLRLAAGDERRGAGLSPGQLCSDSNLFDGRLTIYFGDPCNEIANDGTLAIGGFYSSGIETRTVNGTTFRQIVKGYVINSDEGGVAGWLRTSQCFQDVQTHELGHAVGLGHTSTPGNIMNPVIDNACLQNPPPPGTGELGGDDVDGVRFIYPVSAPPPGPVLPAAPTALTVEPASSGSVALRWTDNANNESSFKLQRRTDSGSWTTVWLNADTTQYTDSGLDAGTYCYRIRSHNADGYSEYTLSMPECISISGGPAPPDDAAPAAPSGLSAIVTTSGRVRLTWTDNADNENSFKLQRRSPDGPWETVWLLRDVTSYADVVPGSGDYCYRIRAHSPDGYSTWTWSTPACVTVDVGSGGGSPEPADPAAPSDLIATAVSSRRIDLTWTDNAADELGFKMQRRRDGGYWETIWLYRNTTSYSDRDLPAGSYCYRIRSYTAEVSSSYTSSSLSCTTIGH